MKKQLAIMTASLVLAATLAGCAQPAQRSAAHMNYIGADAAKNMAAADAQVDTANASFSGANLGEKNGLSYYQVDFTANGREYHYAIDAMTGTVIESSSAASAQQTTGTGQQTATDVYKRQGYRREKRVVVRRGIGRIMHKQVAEE